MESDEFYDSLDDSEFDCLENTNQEKHLQHENNIGNETDKTLDDDIIPFYDKKLTKSQVELSKKSSDASTVINKESNRKKLRPRKKIRNKQKLSSKSYLDLFYARIGIENTDSKSSKATCVDFSSRSCRSGDDVQSVYFKTDNSDSSYVSTSQDLALSLTSLMSNLCSVSEQTLDKKGVHNTSTNVSKIPVKYVTELGRLGPDINANKLELYKRRQQYGKKASQSNIIKMVEKKTLENLQKEIKQSKIYT